MLKVVLNSDGIELWLTALILRILSPPPPKNPLIRFECGSVKCVELKTRNVSLSLVVVVNSNRAQREGSHMKVPVRSIIHHHSSYLIISLLSRVMV